jgi:hypothetical protein
MEAVSNHPQRQTVRSDFVCGEAGIIVTEDYAAGEAAIAIPVKQTRNAPFPFLEREHR